MITAARGRLGEGATGPHLGRGDPARRGRERCAAEESRSHADHTRRTTDRVNKHRRTTMRPVDSPGRLLAGTPSGAAALPPRPTARRRPRPASARPPTRSCSAFACRRPLRPRRLRAPQHAAVRLAPHALRRRTAARAPCLRPAPRRRTGRRADRCLAPRLGPRARAAARAARRPQAPAADGQPLPRRADARRDVRVESERRPRPRSRALHEVVFSGAPTCTSRSTRPPMVRVDGVAAPGQRRPRRGTATA